MQNSNNIDKRKTDSLDMLKNESLELIAEYANLLIAPNNNQKFIRLDKLNARVQQFGIGYRKYMVEIEQCEKVTMLRPK